MQIMPLTEENFETDQGEATSLLSGTNDEKDVSAYFVGVRILAV